jgi:hypothetical protein
MSKLGLDFAITPLAFVSARAKIRPPKFCYCSVLGVYSQGLQTLTPDFSHTTRKFDGLILSLERLLNGKPSMKANYLSSR